MTLTREDILISRIVDGAADPADWDEIQRLADADPDTLRRLAEAQRRESALHTALGAVLNAADQAELPDAHSHAVYSFRTRLMSWSGWAAAAVVGLAWLTATGVINRGQSTGPIAGLPVAGSTDAALEQYQMLGYAEGRVLGELPLVLIQSSRLDDGRAEVTYLRRVLERRTVTDVYEPGIDAEGQPTLVPVRITGADGGAL